jgi:hypothetical protein
MFLIRKEQMEFFAKRAREDFVERMAAYVGGAFRGHVPGKSDAEIRAWVAAAMTKADGYGIDTEPEVAQLTLLLLRLGLDAGEDLPWAREALTHPSLAPIGKVRRLVAHARRERVEGIEAFVIQSIAGHA